jgi:hypothetical protein
MTLHAYILRYDFDGIALHPGPENVVATRFRGAADPAD